MCLLVRFFRLLFYEFRVFQVLVLISELLSILDGLVKSPLIGHLVKDSDSGKVACSNQTYKQHQRTCWEDAAVCPEAAIDPGGSHLSGVMMEASFT